MKRILLLTILGVMFFTTGLQAQRRQKVSALTYDTVYFNTLQYRCIGPFRGGRSAAVTGVPGKPNLFYMGSTGGGVWRTRDGGNTWENISDGYFGGSIGSIAVAPSDPNVIYVGGGEVTVRGNVSYGYGIWKSTDAGETWQFSGLPESRHIPRIRVHPNNPDLVYAAVLGDLYKPTQERGVYRSKDGGKTWERILFANENAGAVDLVIDPVNPRILYASTWNVRRTPYSLSSGGPGSALWKSTDGGDTWKKLNKRPGFPKGPIGIIGVSVSAVDNHRVYAIIEAPEGGVFRSDDGGKTWQRTNSDRALRQRAWYYSRIYADPQVLDRVYVMNVSYHVSNDGGHTFKARNAPHGDHHDLWIAPEDNQRMIIADDGGAQVSYDGGENWSTYMNQPTAQFYRVTVDDHFPFRIYGAQQDNSTVRILSRSDGWAITEQDWEPSAGGESAHMAVDPLDNDIVYGGSYDGFLTRYNHRTRQRRAINVWPDNPMGAGAEAMKYRFQWNFPLFFSPHDPHKLYAASNYLHVTTNGGQSWQTISPDLTRNDSTKLGPSGGPITKDNTSVEYYCTIFAAIESPYEKDLLWTGSDDGLVHVSRDGGKTWQNVTPPGLPEWSIINSLEADPFHKGGLYLAATRYKLGDYTPYLFKTEDYGATWKRIDAGIDRQHFTRVVRADPVRQGLLYCGTESGMYISFDDGASWKPFQLNLPIVPITDLKIKDYTLVVATQGRSFWLLDDLSPLRQLNEAVTHSDIYLYQPKPAYLLSGGGGNRQPRKAGKNHPGGLMLYYFLKNKPDSSTTITLKFLEEDGTLIKSYSNKDRDNKLEAKQGTNLFVWNLRYPDAKKFEGLLMWWGMTAGPRCVPGTYKARLIVNQDSTETTFEVKPDPRCESTQNDYQAKFDYLIRSRDKLTEVHQAIIDIRDVRNQLKQLSKSIAQDSLADTLQAMSKAMLKTMDEVEQALYQTKLRSNQDMLNFPIKLNNKLAHAAALTDMGNYRPTDQTLAYFDEITREIDSWLAKWYTVRDQDIPAFNALVHQLRIDVIRVGAQDE